MIYLFIYPICAMFRYSSFTAKPKEEALAILEDPEALRDPRECSGALRVPTRSPALQLFNDTCLGKHVVSIYSYA